MRFPAPALRAARALALVLLAAPAAAQSWSTVPDDDWCRERSWRADFCEVREVTLPADRDVITVNGGKNGGIRVEGWDRDEIRIQAKILVRDADDDEAREVADEIEILTGDEILADGPSQRRGPNWSVSYRLAVPHRSDLSIEASNGGITIVDVTGTLDFVTRNGGIRLAHVGGDVRGRTRNGGIDVVLDGHSWDGEGLDLETTNGGIELEIPEDYSARLQTGTTNGGVRSDIPIRVDSRRRPKRVRTTLGDGGALIRVETTNGGVSIRES